MKPDSNQNWTALGVDGLGLCFCSKCCFFYETYPHSNVDKK